MIRVLLIDDDDAVRLTVGRVLRLHGYEFAESGTGRDGVEQILHWHPDVVLVDLRLPDMSGLDVLKCLAEKRPQIARIIFSGYATLDTATIAMRLGTCDCLVKPTSPREIVQAVERAVIGRLTGIEGSVVPLALTESEPHAATRWAHPITRLIDASYDPRTLREFAKAVFVSVGCFRNWCRTTRVSSRASLGFARGLRAVYRFEHDHSVRPENLLSIVDQRTIVKFVTRSGGRGDRLPDTVSDFLERQTFIANHEAVEAVRSAVRNREAFIGRGANGSGTHGNPVRRDGPVGVNMSPRT